MASHPVLSEGSEIAKPKKIQELLGLCKTYYSIIQKSGECQQKNDILKKEKR